jgi:SAM-dependent methyltransferase
MKVAEYYDAVGGTTYDQQHPPKVSFARLVRRLVRSGDRILEVGCGTGNILVPLVHGPAGGVAGIEPSFGLLAEAQRKLPDGVLLALADGVELPFPDKSFDIVFARGIMHHTPRQLEIVEEMIRVSRRHIVINDAINAVGRLMRQVGLRRGYPTHPDYPDADYWGGPDQGPCYFPRFFEIRNLFRARGYSVDVIKDKPYRLFDWCQREPYALVIRHTLPWWLMGTGIIHAYPRNDRAH